MLAWVQLQSHAGALTERLAQPIAGCAAVIGHSGGPLARRAPEGISTVPVVSQVAARQTTTACLPTRSWFRVTTETERPLLTATSTTVQTV